MWKSFQDGNGRVGRLLLFKECLRNGIVPFKMMLCSRLMII